MFLPHNFLSGFAILISRTPHQLISIDIKQFVQETWSRVINNFSVPLSPASCTSDNGNKVKVANWGCFFRYEFTTREYEL